MRPEVIPFTGSYRADQTVFLLKPVEVPSTAVEEKERLIQSASRHYSEMLTREAAPDAQYVAFFRRLVDRYADRLASEVNALAATIQAETPGPVTLVSLARAGTPIGALLKVALDRLGLRTTHFSASIILGRGIDENALRHVLRTEGCAPESVRFVDGWTAKGSIGRELRSAVARWNARNPEQLDPRLYVVLDLGGTAEVQATLDDYALPCGIMNATVSGLVSRSVLTPALGPDDFHGCAFYDHLAAEDLTQWFQSEVVRRLAAAGVAERPSAGDVARRRARVEAWLGETLRRRDIARVDRLKPGVAEATRGVLRRNPGRVLVRDPAHPDVEHLLCLAAQRGLPVETDESMPYQAMTIIKEVHV